MNGNGKADYNSNDAKICVDMIIRERSEFWKKTAFGFHYFVTVVWIESKRNKRPTLQISKVNMYKYDTGIYNYIALCSDSNVLIPFVSKNSLCDSTWYDAKCTWNVFAKYPRPRRETHSIMTTVRDEITRQKNQNSRKQWWSQIQMRWHVKLLPLSDSHRVWSQNSGKERRTTTSRGITTNQSALGLPVWGLVLHNSVTGRYHTLIAESPIIIFKAFVVYIFEINFGNHA